ncbi:Ger(x)C family spore germination protein [Lentibacillus salicampi]|uniref:Ger(X)C family spore germination protein n=1 Tax=Lentibacillus salicampi TaxID=175306 RepID=A0A4Y9AEQ6_9BACI|nr:Ger(x)C family spore germination protein [Lentibacillus salicampi]TFJ93577.1 Ger(x)C family spore germination protein [Lentibacillus salicampi]
MGTSNFADGNACWTALTGCWNAVEINDLSTVDVIGIDVNNAGKVEVTAVITRPYTLFPDTAVEGQGQNKFLAETVTGESILEAFGKISGSIPEKIYYGHTSLVVFGEQAAREGISASLDFIKRENDFRPNIQLMVTRGSAKQFVKTTPQFNISLGLEMNDLLISNRYAATGMVNDVSQFMEAFSSETADPYTGVVNSAKEDGIDVDKGEKQKTEQPNAGNRQNQQQQNVPNAMSLGGAAAFKGGQLKGILNEQETRGLMAIEGKLQNQIFVLNCGKNQGTATITITDVNSKLSPLAAGGAPKMAIDIQVEGDIGQLTCSNLNMNSQQVERFNQQLEDLIKRDVSTVLEKVKNEWQTDIFKFGEEFYRKYPEEWKQMAPQWRNGLLKKMKIDLTVSASLSRYGEIKDPAKPNK